MGSGASSKATSTVLSSDDFPKKLFVEGAGNERANGTFVLQVDNHSSPPSRKEGKFIRFNRSVWFCKDDDAGCWMGFINNGKKREDEAQDQRKWIICTAQEILYMAPITGEKITPHQGRWELGDAGIAPAPTVNLQPLPAAFRLTGWTGDNACLNGEYLPLDDGTRLLNQRPIFKHAPVVGVWAGKFKYWMYWSHDAWRIGNKDQMPPGQIQCVALLESNSTHPTAMAGVAWKGTASGCDFSKDKGDFQFSAGVSATTGTSARINVSTIEGGAVTSLTVRPWLDTVNNLQARVFATGTPSQRQQLFVRGERLQDDGRVLAQLGVNTGCTIHLVTLKENKLLDLIFDDSGPVESIAVVGDATVETIMGAYWGGAYNSADGRIYLCPRCASRAARFEPVTKTWETFGDIFPETQFLGNDKWTTFGISNVDNCMYSFPNSLTAIHKMLKVDPINSTAQMVGEDLRPKTGGVKTWVCHDTVAGADGCLYGIPCQVNCILRFDPRTNKISTFGQLEDNGLKRNYPPGVLDESGRERKYACGVLGPSERYIFCIPMMASRVLCIDTQELTVELIGDDFGQLEGDNWLSHIKYLWGALAGDNCIYGIPFSTHVTRILRIDPTAKTASYFGPRLRVDNFVYWGGGCVGMDGCIYGTPHNTDRVLRIDPFAGTVCTVGDVVTSEVRQTLYTGVCDRDGTIWFLPCHCPARMLRLVPGRRRTPLLTTLSQSQHFTVLREGLHDLRCYGSALAVALWREAVRIDGDPTLVCGLLEAAATALPTVITTSIQNDNGSMARMLLLTILTILPPQEKDYYFNSTCKNWDWHQAEAQKRGMFLASVASEEEHKMLHSITRGAETWLGGRRKSTSSQPTNQPDPVRFKGGEDWEWSDGTPFSFTMWNPYEPNNGSGEKWAGEDGVCISQNTWHDAHTGKEIAGIYRKPRCPPPLQAICALVTDQNLLPACFAASDELRGLLVRVIYRVLSLKGSVSPAQPPVSKADGAPSSQVDPTSNRTTPTSAIARHVETEWPNLAAALEAIRRAPPALSANDRDRFAFLAHFVAAQNSWEPLPASADDWSWPPAPLVSLRAVCKIVQKLGTDIVRAVWPVLAGAISTLLVRMVDAVRADIDHATTLLRTIFDCERKASLDTYHKQLRRARRDPTFPEFRTTAADLLKHLAKLNRQQLRVQSTPSFPKLYAKAHALRPRFNDFLAKLAQKCAAATALQAPLKGIARALEKLVLRPGAAAQFKVEGVEAVNATVLVDMLRGSLKCPDFTNIVFVLDLLRLLDVDMGDPRKAKTQGWDLDQFQIRIVHLKDRFNTPTSGGWADAMVNFTFAHGDDTHHVMELQLQHEQMLVVRKEGKAHAQYNSFRSAFELLEAVGREPHDSFEETHEDLSPLEKMEQQIETLLSGMHELKDEVHELKVENELLRSRLENLEQQTTITVTV